MKTLHLRNSDNLRLLLKWFILSSFYNRSYIKFTATVTSCHCDILPLFFFFFYDLKTRHSRSFALSLYLYPHEVIRNGMQRNFIVISWHYLSSFRWLVKNSFSFCIKWKAASRATICMRQYNTSYDLFGLAKKVRSIVQIL